MQKPKAKSGLKTVMEITLATLPALELCVFVAPIDSNDSDS